MFRKRSIVAFAVAAAFVTLPVFSQSEMETPRQEASVQGFGSFVKSTTHDGIENKATNSGGVLGNYRFFFNAHHGVEANYGYSLNTQSYGLPSGVVGVKTYSHEISGAYVFRQRFGKLTAFALAGAGALVFDPKDFTGAKTQTRAAFIYGAGADYPLSHHLFVRAEYRGFVYNSPTYDLQGLAGTDRVTHRAEPSVGFGYRF